MSIQENNLIRGVALNDGQVGQIDYNFLANQPTINGQPAAGELSEVLALKGETSEIHTGSDEPPASAKVWIDPNGDDAVSLPETIEQVVKEYMEENPVSLPEKLPNPYKLTITGAVSAEYDGSEMVEVEIPAGSGIPIPNTASIGQTIVVKAVDEASKPTEWEAADLPSGGGAGWEIIADITTTEEVDVVAITTDADGNAFELSDAVISVVIVGTGSNTAESPLGISVNARGSGGGRNTSASRMFRSTGTFKCAYRLGAHAEVIIGQVHNVGNSATATDGFYKSWDSTTMRAFYFDGGIFGIGSRLVIEGVRK